MKRCKNQCKLLTCIFLFPSSWKKSFKWNTRAFLAKTLLCMFRHIIFKKIIKKSLCCLNNFLLVSVHDNYPYREFSNIGVHALEFL